MNPRREALTLARERIYYGRDTFICFALGDTADERPDLRAACKELGQRIRDELEGELDLGGWLDRRGLYCRSEIRQLCRLAWLDKLISEETT